VDRSAFGAFGIRLLFRPYRAYILLPIHSQGGALGYIVIALSGRLVPLTCPADLSHPSPLPSGFVPRFAGLRRDKEGEGTWLRLCRFRFITCLLDVASGECHGLY